MTHEDRGHYRKKHPPDIKADPKIAEAVEQKALNGELPCAAAFEIAADLNAQPAELGFTADFLEISIIHCQLGLFGYKPKKKVVKPAETMSQTMETAVRDAIAGGRLSCASAWEIAERFKVGKMEVSSVCEALKVKISACQLGAF